MGVGVGDQGGGLKFLRSMILTRHAMETRMYQSHHPPIPFSYDLHLTPPPSGIPGTQGASQKDKDRMTFKLNKHAGVWGNEESYQMAMRHYTKFLGDHPVWGHKVRGWWEARSEKRSHGFGIEP